MRLLSVVRVTFLQYRIWLFDAWLDVQGQFRRSTLGPLWISINGIIFTIGIAIVFSRNNAVSFNDYLFYVYTGIWVWQFIQSLVLQGSLCFVASSANLINLPFHPFLYIVQNSFKQIISWLFGLPLYILLASYTHQKINSWCLLSVLNLTVSAIGISFILVVVAHLCLIYRDIHQVVVNFMQLMFFITPIVWLVDGNNSWSSMLSSWNPLSWLLIGIREPLRFHSPGESNEIKILIFLMFSIIVANLGISKLESASKYV